MARKKNTREFNIHTDAEALKALLSEASDVKTEIEASNDTLKDIRTRAKDEIGLKPRKFNKLLGMYHKRNREEIEAESEELIDIYDKTFNAKSV